VSVTAIASWVGSGIAVITAGLCWLLLRHLDHLPSATHPWLHRAAIIGMYCAGAVFVFTPAGRWLLSLGQRALGVAGASTAPGSGLGWALVTLAALSLAAAVFVALVWTPDPRYAYVALATPLVLALAPGGFAHQIYVVTAAPAQQLVTTVATWAGG
jgi:hypothetical protein